MYNFGYVKPATLADAVEAMRGEEAQAIAGGQTLIPTLKQRLAMPGTLVDVSGVPEMRGICTKDSAIAIGGATTHREIMESSEVKAAIPALSEMASHIGDPQVRNLGTIGGSLANNDPAACYPSAVLALGATIHTSNDRSIAADQYFQGMFTTTLDEDELIVSVDIPVPEAASYQKFIQPASRFALVGVFAARMTGGEARIGVTGASEEGVFRWTDAEQALSSNWSPDAVDSLSLSADGMIKDIHGTPEYRAHIARVMTARAVKASG